MERTRILVVDDEKDVLGMFEKYLRMRGFQVLTAPNVLEALRIQKRDAPDIILTDYNMPEMNGIDLLRELHKVEPGLPVIMMSGAADMRTAAEALREEAFDFLAKPVDAEELVRTIHLALARKAVPFEPDPEPEPDVDPAAIGKVVGPVYSTRHQKHPAVTILNFNRPLDEHSQKGYEKALVRLENEGDLRKKMVIDLKNVSYINNVGLNFLVDTFKRWKSQKKETVFTQLSDPVYQYLKTLGYLDFFPVAATLAEALEDIG